MTSIKLPIKFRKKNSLKEKKASKKQAKIPASSEKYLLFDMFAHMTYMASIATAGIPRSELFDYSAKMPYSSAKYFHEVQFLAQKVNIDYAEACRMVAGRTKLEEVRGFLLRLSGALTSGEDEEEFLLRESEAMADNFANRYERDVESLKKWTDAYVTLVVAAGLIVIVSVISMMIYEVGTHIIVGLAFTMVFVTCLGGWIIYISSPHEIKTRVRGPTSGRQILGTKLFTILAPVAATVGSLMFMANMDRGHIFLVIAALIFLPGYLMNRDDKKITKYDEDIPTVVRVLGGVTSAIGTTVKEALNQIDKRSMGSLMPSITRLKSRLDSGINPKLCWARFVDETGSELVDRTVTMFWDAIDLGADAGKAGIASSIFSAKISHLRATRTMVAATFRWLILPLHLAMVGLLLFIPEIMKLFTLQIQESADSLSSDFNLPNSSLELGDVFAFGNVNLALIDLLVTIVVVVLTISNAYAPKAADGGNNIKFVHNLSIMMTITGVLMIIIPMGARSLFQSIVSQ